MKNRDTVITGLGLVTPAGVGKDIFSAALNEGRDCISKITSFDASKFSVNKGGEVKNFNPGEYFDEKELRNLDRNAQFLSVATKLALAEAKIDTKQADKDEIGMVTATTFSHLWSIVEFDREVFKEGINFASPALFPSTVMNAASSQAAIIFKIQGFNTTLSTGYTSALMGLEYGIEALEAGNAKQVLCASVDSLTHSLYLGFYSLGYMAGLKGKALSCPFDKRRNGPLLAEGAVSLCLEDLAQAKARKIPVLAKIKSVVNYFDAFQMGRIHPQGEGLEKAIVQALEEAEVTVKDIDYISSCANSSPDEDRIEVKVLKKVFGSQLKKIPVSSIKSMFGDTLSASAGLQIASCINAMHNGVVPPTINFNEHDPECDIDCVANKAQKKAVKRALVVSFGPGGYNAACVLECSKP